MDQFITFFSERPLQCLIIAIGCFFMGIYLHGQAKAMRFAEWVAGKGQYQRIDLTVLDEAIQEAEDANQKDEFIRYLRVIRTAVGHENLKIGHLYWIWDQMEKKITADTLTSVPSFDEADPIEIQVQR